MKKSFLMLAFSLLAVAAQAQTAPKTETKVRDNGTVKTTTTTGKTNVGQALENTADAAENVGEKGVKAVKSGAKKTAHATKRGGQKVSAAAKRGTAKMEAKTE